MKVSLVLATVDRTHEVSRFLTSLAAQRYADLELIVVDQNLDDRLVELLAVHQGALTIRHVRSARGLSKARNVGLQFVSGEIVAFPDDDCWYPSGVLQLVTNMLSANRVWSGVTGRSEDGLGRSSGARFDASPGAIDLNNVWTRGISYTIFLRREAADAIGLFDEELGVGAGTRFGSAEETDYLIRGIRAGLHIAYVPDLIVFHPNPTKVFDERTWRRARSYGAGMGRVLRKHRCRAGIVATALIRPIGGALLSATSGKLAKARYHWNVLRGRIEGLVATHSDVIGGRP
ncbi:MAG: glycosyltransferase [Betaproteobacteria bacterium]